jgi:ATP-dependent Lhr-like helicase
LGTKKWFIDGDSILLLGWHGDTVQDALALFLTARGVQSSNEGAAMRISSTDQQSLLRLLQEIGSGPAPTIADLKIKAEYTIREKWDWVLPDGLRLRSFASAQLDLPGAQRLALTLSQGPTPSMQ